MFKGAEARDRAHFLCWPGAPCSAAVDSLVPADEASRGDRRPECSPEPDGFPQKEPVFSGRLQQGQQQQQQRRSGAH